MNNKYVTIVGLIERKALIILESYLPTTHAAWKAEVRPFYQAIIDFIGLWGMPQTIQYVKSSRVAVLRTLTGKPLTSTSEGNVGLENGWPKWLAAFKIDIPSDRNITESELDKIRYLLTLLSSLRSIMVPPVADLEPITKPYGGSIFSIDDAVLRKVMFKLSVGRHTGCKVQWDRFHFTTKSGPNGPALLSSSREFGSAINAFGPELKTLGGSSFAQTLNFLSNKLIIDPTVKLGKLAYFSDKEGKTRLVAMCDYWSQTVLKPYHQKLMSLLGTLKTDCTFDHNRAVNYLLNLPGPYHSLDLSNATDRMPFWLQKSIMSFIFGADKSGAWARLLVERDYTFRNLASGRSGEVLNLRYATGQPMGAYSSWASMAFTHHFIIQWAALLSGHTAEKGMFKNYVVLGDDVVIADSKVAESYVGLLSSLDMPYSKAKTHVSLDSFEFAKRWIMFRKEVTPFSIGGLDRVMGRYSLLFSFLSNQATHSWLHRDSNNEFSLVLKLIQLELDVSKRPISSSDKRRILASRVLLYKLFYYLQHFRANMDHKVKKWPYGLRLLRSEVASTEFSKQFLQLFSQLGTSVESFGDFYTPSLIACAIRVAIRQIAERDLRDFQRSLKGTLVRVSSIDPRLLTAGTETGSVLHWLPPVNCLAHLFHLSIEALQEPEKIFEEGIAKFFIGKGVLNLDRSKQSILAESAVVKRLATYLQSFSLELKKNPSATFGSEIPAKVRIDSSFLFREREGPAEFLLDSENPPVFQGKFEPKDFMVFDSPLREKAVVFSTAPSSELFKLRMYDSMSFPSSNPGGSNGIGLPHS